jgi:two-component system CheB/CheR fusion protein
MIDAASGDYPSDATSSSDLSSPAISWLLVDRNLDIRQVGGDLSPWLGSHGSSSANLLSAAPPELRRELIGLLAELDKGATDTPSVITRPPQGGETRLELRRLRVRPGDDPAQALFAITFLRLVGGFSTLRGADPREEAEVTRLRGELVRLTGRMRSIIRDRDATHAELVFQMERPRSSTAELESSNAELAKIRAELHRARDEWEDSQEALRLVNTELRIRNQGLARLSDHLASLLSSTTIPILMLDRDLCIRRVTPAAEGLFGIRQTHIGRHIGDVQWRIRERDLETLVSRVIQTLTGEEVEVLDRDGRWHLLRIRPYRTVDDRIEGAVLAMIDIDQLRRAHHAANAASRFAESLIEAVQTPLLVLDRRFRVLMANPIFLSVYSLQLREIETRSLETLGKHQWNSPELKAALERLARGESHSEDLELEQGLPGNLPDFKRIVMVNVRRIAQSAIARGATAGFPNGGTARDRSGEFCILLAATDITAQKRAEKIMLDERERLRRSVIENEEALRRSREELRALAASLLNAQDEERRRVSRELHDDVSQNIAKLQFDIETLERELPPALANEKTSLVKISQRVGQLSDELRRIAYALHPSTLDHLGLAVALRGFCREFAKRTRMHVRFTAGRLPSRFPPDIANSLYRITQEALRNVGRHASDSSVNVRLACSAASVKLTIRDDGPGFDSDAIRNKGGLGLISMQERARLIHASFDLATQPGAGATITVTARLSNDPSRTR